MLVIVRVYLPTTARRAEAGAAAAAGGGGLALGRAAGKRPCHGRRRARDGGAGLVLDLDGPGDGDNAIAQRGGEGDRGGAHRHASWEGRRRRNAAGVDRVDEGLARIVVAGRGGRDEVSGLTVGGEAGARVHVLVEAEDSEPRVEDRRILDGQHHPPSLVSVNGASREDGAGVIAGVGAPHDELRVERIDDRPRRVTVQRDMPALRPAGVQREQLAQILHEVVNAVGADVGPA